MTVIFTSSNESHQLLIASGGDWTASSGAGITAEDGGLAGTGHRINVDINDTTLDYVSKTEFNNTSGHLRVRFYFDPNSVPTAASRDFPIIRTYNHAYDVLVAVQFYISTEPAYKIRFYTYNDAAAQQLGALTTITDAEHYFEFYLTLSTGDNGTLTTWIDGDQIDALSGIDNNTRFAQFDHVRTGDVAAPGAAVAGSIYLDEYVINDDGSEIGPYAVASESPSASPSKSPSVSPSVSPSKSPSVSPSESPSASAAPPIEGSACWGHTTGVIEDNIQTFSGNWTGTGEISGAGDAEILCLDVGEEMISEVVFTSTLTCEIDQNHYDITGEDLYLYYRHGATQANCEAAAWIEYTVPFMSLGYVQIRVVYEAPS